MQKIRIMIADDHAILRAGLRSLLNAQPDMEVVAEAVDGEETISLVREHSPDVLLLDITMPKCSGIKAIGSVREVSKNTRVLVLTFWEVVLEVTAAGRQRRRNVEPRGHRGGYYPLMRAALCVFVRDLIVYGVLTDMMKGRPAIYATFSSYDEVAHHSGLERADTLEALRKLDQQFGRIERARRYAPRPYEIVVLSDHGQTQGATFKQRNGYGLDELVERSLARGDVSGIAGGDEQNAMMGLAVDEATGRADKQAKRPKNDVSDRDVIVLGSGNLGLVYLMEERRRLTLEELDERHPELIPPELTVTFVLSASPDTPNAPGEYRGRLNANGVDVNRNWDCQWAADTLWQGELKRGSGGAAPFSEAESRVLRDFILGEDAAAVIFWQARAVGGLASPGGCGPPVARRTACGRASG